MRKISRSSVVLAAVLIVLATVGCSATPERVYVSPQCSVPPQPTVPNIDSEALASVDDETYWRLEERERLLVDWAFELRAILKEVCEDKSNADA